MTYNELAELFKREGGDAQVCFSVISQNQILFGNNDTKKDIISFKNDEPIKWMKEAQEEPVSIDFEQELYKAFGQVKDFTLGMRIAKWFYDMGKNSHEPVSEDLEDAAYNYVMKNYGNPKESSFIFEQRCFKAGAKWQKKKDEY